VLEERDAGRGVAATHGLAAGRGHLEHRAELGRRDLTELGEIPAAEFAAVMELATPAGESLLRRNSPAGIALLQQRPSHASVMATTFDGARRPFEATAYPLFATSGDMHGVIAVFWESDTVESTD